MIYSKSFRLLLAFACLVALLADVNSYNANRDRHRQKLHNRRVRNRESIRNEKRSSNANSFLGYLDPYASNNGQTMSILKETGAMKKVPVTRGLHQIRSIYENVKYGNQVFDDPNINTIRYVPSVKVDVDEEKFYFMFNLSQLTTADHIMRSNLYINNRYARLRLSLNLHYFFTSSSSSSDGEEQAKNLTRNPSQHSMTIDLKNTHTYRARPRKQNGWQIFNIADSVNNFYRKKRAFNNRPANGVYNKSVYFTYRKDDFEHSANSFFSGDDLILLIESSTVPRRFLPKFRSKFPSESFNPYLMIYSSESENKMKRFFSSRLPNFLNEAIENEEKRLENEEIMDRKELDASWSTFNQPAESKSERAEMSELKRFEDQVDETNSKKKGKEEAFAFYKSFDAEKKKGFYSLNLSNNQKASSSSKYPASTTTTTKTTTTTTTTTKKIAKQANTYLNYLPKDLSRHGLIKTMGSSEPNELKFIIDDANKLNVFSMKRKMRRDARRRRKTRRQTRSRALRMSPSFEDIYEDEELKSMNEKEMFDYDDDDDDHIDADDDEDEYENNSFSNEKEWTNTNQHEQHESSGSDGSGACKAQPINIDFVDLSFSEWIIEPKRFQSNYCAGSCKYPQSDKSVESNYATLQGILNVLKINDMNNPTELCCTPSQTRSLPILYIDKNAIDHVVKLLPDMVVDSCSCN